MYIYFTHRGGLGVWTLSIAPFIHILGLPLNLVDILIRLQPRDLIVAGEGLMDSKSPVCVCVHVYTDIASECAESCYLRMLEYAHAAMHIVIWDRAIHSGNLWWRNML